MTAAERAAVAEAFGVPVTDMFVATEGLVGHSEPGGTVLTFASDTCIAECVDDGRPVPDGVASARVLVTNLHNLTQRYGSTRSARPNAGPTSPRSSTATSTWPRWPPPSSGACARRA